MSKDDIEEKINDIVCESKSVLYQTKMPVNWSEAIAEYMQQEIDKAYNKEWLDGLGNNG